MQAMNIKLQIERRVIMCWHALPIYIDPVSAQMTVWSDSYCYMASQ